MIKKIEIPDEALVPLKEGRYVEGSIHIDKESGKIIFNAWKRKRPKHPKDQVICYHGYGWMKMSENNLKFFASVPKRVGAVYACQTMDDNLQYATEVVTEKIENGEISKNDLTLY